jgi:sucrose phosphorylase
MRSLPDGSESPYELNSTWFELVGAGRPEEEAIELHLATHAVMLAMRGIPALYVHSLFGSPNDSNGFSATGRARSLNRHKFTDLAALERSLAEPTSRARGVFAGAEQMARIRMAHPAFHPDADQRIPPAPPGVFAVERTAKDGSRARVDMNFGNDPVDVDSGPGPWEPMLGDPDETIEPRRARWLTSA